MTTKEITKIIREYEDKTQDNFGHFIRNLHAKPTEYAGLTFKYIEDFRSPEGDHDQWEYYFYIGDEIFGVSGYYHSENGIDMDYCIDTLTKYERVEVTRWEYRVAK